LQLDRCRSWIKARADPVADKTMLRQFATGSTNYQRQNFFDEGSATDDRTEQRNFVTDYKLFYHFNSKSFKESSQFEDMVAFCTKKLQDSDLETLDAQLKRGLPGSDDILEERKKLVVAEAAVAELKGKKKSLMAAAQATVQRIRKSTVTTLSLNLLFTLKI
jgi:hypothetical protein